MFCLQIVSSDEEDIENIPKMLLDEAIAVWKEVTPSGEPDDALLATMPAEWAAPLVCQGFDSIPRVVSPRLLSRAPSVAGTTDPGSDAVPGTPGSEEPPDSPVNPVDPPGSPSTPDPPYWRICQKCGEESNGSSQHCPSCVSRRR